MPTFRFKCVDPKCAIETKKIVSSDIDAIYCECGNFAAKMITTNASSTIYETKGRKSIKRGVEKDLSKRSKEHHNEYELAEKIDKYGKDEAIRNGWDKKIKKT